MNILVICKSILKCGSVFTKFSIEGKYLAIGGKQTIGLGKTEPE